MFRNRKFLVITILLVIAIATAGFTALASNTAKVPAKADDAVAKDEAALNNVQDAQTESQKANSAELQLEDKDTNKKPEVITYVIKSGDTLGEIANIYSIDTSAIAQSNGISENSVLTEGQQVRFPSVKGVLYKIKEGETLWDISSANDVDVQEIASANSIDSPDKLKIGQEIIIPGVDKVNVRAAALTAKVNSRTSGTSNVKPTNIQLASRGTSAAGSSSTGFIWPLRGVITSYFGTRVDPISGKPAYHEGIDIAAPTGTDIKAATNGTVIYSGWKNDYGNYIKMSNGNGIETYYSHNSKNLVSVGQRVSKGEVIAKVGSTGRATGPHVEFGITKNGKAVNPLSYLK